MNLQIHGMSAIRRRSETAFTLIEIALCIAIVAFALVAIIGVLPTGLEVQRENREDTVINQDAQVLIDAIRSGSTNSTALTNNIDWVDFFVDNSSGPVVRRRVYGTNLTFKQALGAMCTPKYLNLGGVDYTNRTMMRFRAISRPLAMEATNVQDLTFSYLLTSEVVPLNGLNGSISPFGADPNVTAALGTNLWELRLLFEWPIIRDLTNASTVGSGRRVVRSMVAARLVQEDQTNNLGVVTNTLWFFTPGKFASY